MVLSTRERFTIRLGVQCSRRSAGPGFHRADAPQNRVRELLWALPSRLSLRNFEVFERHRLAEGVGFEPTRPFGSNGFQDRRYRPLSHPSIFIQSL